MKAYSIDLRQKIVDAYDRKLGGQKDIAESFGVSLSFMEKLLHRRRTTGSISALPHGGGNKALLDDEARVFVDQLVREQPDATLEELCEAVNEQRGIRVSVATMWAALKRMGLPRKKSRSTQMSATPKGSSRPESNSEKKSPL